MEPVKTPGSQFLPSAAALIRPHLPLATDVLGVDLSQRRDMGSGKVPVVMWPVCPVGGRLAEERYRPERQYYRRLADRRNKKRLLRRGVVFSYRDLL